MRAIEKLNEYIQKVGVDKALHFFCGGWIVAMFTPVGLESLPYSLIALFLVSIIKECVDSVFDWYDIAAGMAGGVLAAAIYIIMFVVLL